MNVIRTKVKAFDVKVDDVLVMDAGYGSFSDEARFLVYAVEYSDDLFGDYSVSFKLGNVFNGNTMDTCRFYTDDTVTKVTLE